MREEGKCIVNNCGGCLAAAGGVEGLAAAAAAPPLVFPSYVFLMNVPLASDAVTICVEFLLRRDRPERRKLSPDSER